MSRVDKKAEDVFFTLLRAGLWEKDIKLSSYGVIDYQAVYKLAEEQSVVGIIAAGLEHVSDVKVPQEIALTFVGTALQLEQRNIAMNSFIAKIIDDLRKKDIYALLVKGQGVAQCYERPLWRASGDVDLLLSDSNYVRAKEFLIPLAQYVEQEEQYEQHIGMVINKWQLELHGNLRTRVSSKLDKGIINIQKELFYGGSVRSWMNGNTQIFLPSVNIDVILIFTHILKHYYREGVGLRQVCDWMRLLWFYRDEINKKYLESWIRKMGVISEWRVFTSLAVDYLGMPADAMPFYSNNRTQKIKSKKVLSDLFTMGNMGHNRDLSYQDKHTPVIRKIITFCKMLKESIHRFFFFPMNSLRAFCMFTRMGLSDIRK